MDTFSAFKIGSLDIPNRLMMAPVKTGYGTSTGEVTHETVAYYQRRAQGGSGAIIVEPLFIDPRGKEHPKQLGISSDNYIDGLQRVVTSIHKGGSLAIAHINHAGRAANPKASGEQPEAPSVVACPTTGATPVAMTGERIQELIKKFADAARRAVEAGFDAVEIQCGLGYLIAQFLSPKTNQRTDEYALTSENRFRFVTEVLEAVKAEIGPSFPLLARMSATEQSPDGMSISEGITIAQVLEQQGIDALHVVSGSACDSPPWYYQHMRLPMGKNVEWAKQIKKQVSIPVIVAGRLGDPNDIHNILAEEAVDAIALGRPLVADPDLPNKMRTHLEHTIIQCGACLQGCLMKVKAGVGLRCIVNPEVGRETVHMTKPERTKKVVVVGGGPAGMQAALTASERGHTVVLYEKHALGGQFHLSYLPPGKEMMKRPLSSLINRVQQRTITLHVPEEATIPKIVAEQPDIVILATGASPIIPSIPGLQSAFTGEDILTDKVAVGKHVLIIGGGMVGLECAEYLAKRKHTVTVVELLSDVARDMDPITRKMTLTGLVEEKVKIFTDTKVTRFDGKKAYIERNGTEQILGTFDAVVVAVGTKAANNLESDLRKEHIDVVVIGDAKKPRQIFDAVQEGFEAAIAV